MASKYTKALTGLTRNESAAYWDSLLRSGHCNHEDRAAFKVWRDSDPENSKVFDRAQRLIDELSSIADAPEIKSLRETALIYSNAVDRKSRFAGVKQLLNFDNLQNLITVRMALNGFAVFGVLLLSFQILPIIFTASQDQAQAAEQKNFAMCRSNIPDNHLSSALDMEAVTSRESIGDRHIAVRNIRTPACACGCEESDDVGI